MLFSPAVRFILSPLDPWQFWLHRKSYLGIQLAFETHWSRIILCKLCLFCQQANLRGLGQVCWPGWHAYWCWSLHQQRRWLCCAPARHTRYTSQVESAHQKGRQLSCTPGLLDWALKELIKLLPLDDKAFWICRGDGRSAAAKGQARFQTGGRVWGDSGLGRQSSSTGSQDPALAVSQLVVVRGRPRHDCTETGSLKYIRGCAITSF